MLKTQVDRRLITRASFLVLFIGGNSLEVALSTNMTRWFLSDVVFRSKMEHERLATLVRRATELTHELQNTQTHTGQIVKKYLPFLQSVFEWEKQGHSVIRL